MKGLFSNLGGEGILLLSKMFPEVKRPKPLFPALKVPNGDGFSYFFSSFSTLGYYYFSFSGFSLLAPLFSAAREKLTLEGVVF